MMNLALRFEQEYARKRCAARIILDAVDARYFLQPTFGNRVIVFFSDGSYSILPGRP